MPDNKFLKQNKFLKSKPLTKNAKRHMDKVSRLDDVLKRTDDMIKALERSNKLLEVLSSLETLLRGMKVPDAITVKNLAQIQEVKGKVVATIDNWPIGSPMGKQVAKTTSVEGVLVNAGKIESILRQISTDFVKSQSKSGNGLNIADLKKEKDPVIARMPREDFGKLLKAIGMPSSFEAQMTAYLKTISDTGVNVISAPRNKINPLEFGTPINTSVDNSAQLVFDSSGNQTAVALIITNAGADDIYLYPTNSVSSTLFIKKLGAGETWEIALGGENSTTNDLYAIRATAQTDDDVIVMPLTEM